MVAKMDLRPSPRLRRRSSSRAGHASGAERGVALVLVLLLGVVILGLVGVSLATVGARGRDTTERGILDRVRRAADAAIALKAHEIDTRDDLEPITVVIEGVTVTVTPYGPTTADRVVLDAEAAVAAGQVSQDLHLVATLRPETESKPLFNYATFADIDLLISGAAQTSSYDGAAGAPSALNLGSEGHVGSNGTLTVDSEEAIVDGKLFHPEAVAPVVSAGASTGGTEAMGEPQALPDLIGTRFEDAVAATVVNPTVLVDGSPVSIPPGGDLRLTGGETVVFGPGTYVLGQMTLQNAVNATFSGDASFFADTFNVQKGSSLTVGGEQSVEVVYKDTLAITDFASVSVGADSEGRVLSQRLTLLGMAGSSMQVSAADATGVFYAPEGDALVRDGATVRGTLVGARIEIDGADAGEGTSPEDPGLSGGHFDVDVFYRKADGRMQLDKKDYHEHEYDDIHNTDSFVFFGTGVNGITREVQTATPQAYWSQLVAGQGADTRVEMVLEHPEHASGTYTLELADGRTITGHARDGASGITFTLGEVTSMSIRLRSLAELLGTEPSKVNKDPILRGIENVPLDPDNPKTGAYGIELYRLNADGTRGEIIYDFRTYFHNNTGLPWPLPGTEPDPDAEAPAPPTLAAELVRFDTTLRDYLRIPGDKIYRLDAVLELPPGASVADLLGESLP